MTLNIQIKATINYGNYVSGVGYPNEEWVINVTQCEQGRGRVYGVGKAKTYEDALMKACEHIQEQKLAKVHSESKELIAACLNIAPMKPTKLYLRDAL